MTDPAASRDYLHCSICDGWTRRDLALGSDGVSRCRCGALVDSTDKQAAPMSPIVGRKIYRSPSLKNTATPSCDGPEVANSPTGTNGGHEESTYKIR